MPLTSHHFSSECTEPTCGTGGGALGMKLATDVENDNYIARRFYFVRSEPEREHSVECAVFPSGWRRAGEVSLSNRPALP